MGSNQKRNRSYFEQQRVQMNDPNFYKALTDEELRRQVKRIVKDIRNHNITQQDMIYFKNDRILSACLSVSYEESRKANIIAEALNYYNNTVLYRDGLNDYNNETIIKRNYCINACNEATIKANTWYECWIMFDGISKGQDIEYMLNYINKIDIQYFKYI